MIELICDTCNKKFLRTDYHHKRWISKNYTHKYCSRDCNPHSAEIGNDLIPFRLLVGNINKRGKIEDLDIDENFLKNLYDQQNGQCAITGIPMELKRRLGAKGLFGEKRPYQVSVDRINNDRDYSQDNIHLTTYIANMARNNFSPEDVVNFGKDIARLKMTNLEVADLFLSRMNEWKMETSIKTYQVDTNNV